METYIPIASWDKPFGSILAAREFTRALEAIRAKWGSSFNVVVAENGAELLEKAESVAPDVIVLGEQLPGGSLLDSCRVLRSEPMGRAAFLILVVDSSRPEALKEMLSAGAEFIVDSADLETHLEERLRAALQLSLCRKMNLARVQTSAAEMDSAHHLLDEMRRSVAHCSKKANDAMQVIFLTAESYQLKKIGGAEQWPAFHAECMSQILKATNRIKVCFDDLKRALGADELADAELKLEAGEGK